MPKKKKGKEKAKAPVGDLAIFGPLVAVKQHGGLETLYRDQAYLQLDEEAKEKRIFELRKSRRTAWIKTEIQSIVDRAKLLGIVCLYHRDREKFKMENVTLSVKGGDDEYITKEMLMAYLDKTRNAMLGPRGSAAITVAEYRPPRVTSVRVAVDGGSATVEELEGFPPEPPPKPGETPKPPKAGAPPPPPPKKVRLLPDVYPRAVLANGLRIGRRRALLRILRLGPRPLRIGAISGDIEAGGHWCFRHEGEGPEKSIVSRERGLCWHLDSSGYLFDGGHLVHELGAAERSPSHELGSAEKSSARVPPLMQGDDILVDLAVSDGQV